MKLRGGSVLGKKTILKSDHFPGCQNKRLTPQIDGAPNYRQVFFTTASLFWRFCMSFSVFYFPFSLFMSLIFLFYPLHWKADSLHVHGVAIPTTDGIRNVLNHMGAQKEDGKATQVLWINLREEPVNSFFILSRLLIDGSFVMFI